MYNVDITDERLIIGLGQGPLKNVDVTPNQYYTLINNGYHVIRNYKPTDLHVVHAPREMTLLEGESAKLIERSENIKASHSKMKLITFAIPKEELGDRKYTVTYESSKPDLLTVNEKGMVQAANRLPAGIAASVVKITVTLTVEGIDQPLTDSIEIKVKKNRRNIKPGLTLNVEDKVFSLPHFSLTIKTDLSGDLDETGHGNIGVLVGNPSIAKVVEVEKDKEYRVDTTLIEGQTTIKFFYLKAPNIYKEVRLFVTSDIEKLKEGLNPKTNPENKVVDVTGLKVLPEELILHENQIEPLIVEVLPEQATNKHYNVYVPPTLDGITVATVTNNQVRGLNEGKSVVIVYTDQRNEQGEPMVTKNIPITVTAMNHETESGSTSDKDNHGVNPPTEEQGGSAPTTESQSTSGSTAPTTSEETPKPVESAPTTESQSASTSGSTAPTTSGETPKPVEQGGSTSTSGSQSQSTSETKSESTEASEHPSDPAPTTESDTTSTSEEKSQSTAPTTSEETPKPVEQGGSTSTSGSQSQSTSETQSGSQSETKSESTEASEHPSDPAPTTSGEAPKPVESTTSTTESQSTTEPTAPTTSEEAPKPVESTPTTESQSQSETKSESTEASEHPSDPAPKTDDHPEQPVVDETHEEKHDGESEKTHVDSKPAEDPSHS